MPAARRHRPATAQPGRRAFITALLVALSAAPGAAQHYSFLTFDEIDDAVVYTIYEDSLGFFWLGSENLLWRGQNGGFATVTLGAEAVMRDVRCFAERGQTLLVGSGRGLLGFDVQTLAPRPVPAELAGSNAIHALYVDAHGRAWAGTRQGLYEILGTEPPFDVRLTPGTASLDVFSIAAGEGGALWLAGDGALLHVAGDTVEPRFSGRISKGRNTLLRTRDGSLWIGMRHPGGLLRLVGGELIDAGAELELPNVDVNALLEAPLEAQLWIGTERGVFVLDAGRVIAIQFEQGLSNTDVHAMHADREGLVWVGTFGSGVQQLRSLYAMTFDRSSGLADAFVTDLAVAGDGSVVVGTLHGAMRVDSAVTMLGQEVQIEHVCVDRDQQVWVLGEYDVWRESRHVATLPRILSVAAHPAGGVLVGTKHGLHRIHDDNVAALKLPPNVPDCVQALALDDAGQIWIGTPSGVVHQSATGWTAISEEATSALAFDQNGRLWIGTAGGLWRLDSRLHDVPAPMGIGLVRDLACAADGTVWAATPDGLIRVRGDHVQRFTTADGLPRCSLHCVALGPGGMVYVGSPSGVTRIDAARFEPAAAPPRVVIAEFGPREQPRMQDGMLAVHYEPDQFEARLQGLGWRCSDGLRFQHTIDGFAGGWSAPSPQTVLHLPRLPAGTYTLRVRATNANGRTTAQDACLSFVVVPPLWRQPQFLVPAGALLALLAILGLQYRNQHRRVCDQRAQLQEQSQQTRHLEAVSTLAAGVAHDFNNMMTAILGYRDIAAAAPQNPAVRDALDGITTIAADGQRVVDALLDFGRQRPPHRVPTCLPEIARDTLRLLRPVLRDRIEMHVHLDTDHPLWVSADAGQLRQLFVNLSLNAMDAMWQGGILRLAVQHAAHPPPWAAIQTSTDGVALCTVEDNGPGMPDAVRERAFDPFYSTKPRSAGTGLGLAVVHGIVMDLGGAIRVTAPPDGGTLVCFALPCCPPPGISTATAGAGATDSIWLAEGNSQLRGMIAAHLEGSGFHTVSRANGADLLALAKSGAAPPDLVVAEVCGAQRPPPWLHELRALHPALPAVLLTDLPDPLPPTSPWPTAALAKPFRLNDLRDTARALLAAARRDQASNGGR